MSANATPIPQQASTPALTGAAAPAAPVVPSPIPQLSVRRLSMLTGLALLVLALCGAVFYYVWHQGYYFYATNDAVVAGDSAAVAPMDAGTITRVYHAQGSAIHKGDIIVLLRTPGGGTENATSPINGTIIQESATPGEALQAGQMVAQVVDLTKVYLTAYVEETHINDVHTGQGVDATIDAAGGTTFHGTVTSIQPATANSLSPLPMTDYASGNFTKVTQRVPVRITLDGDEGHTLYPGSSANVTIHIHT